MFKTTFCCSLKNNLWKLRMFRRGKGEVLVKNWKNSRAFWYEMFVYIPKCECNSRVLIWVCPQAAQLSSPAPRGVVGWERQSGCSVTDRSGCRGGWLLLDVEMLSGLTVCMRSHTHTPGAVTYFCKELGVYILHLRSMLQKRVEKTVWNANVVSIICIFHKPFEDPLYVKHSNIASV